MASRKTVLITGCSEGSLGEAFAREFHRRGYRVMATARTTSKMAHLSQMGIDTFELDVASSESIASFVEKMTQPIDILFNNAGISLAMPLQDTTMADFKKLFQVNVFGLVELTQALIPLLIRSRGTIVCHTSQSAYVVSVGNGAYSASKAAVARLADTWRVELAPFGIHVVELVTGLARSNMLARLQNAAIPEGSIYYPIKPEADKDLSSGNVLAAAMPAEVYAKHVVSRLLDGWFGPPAWMWQGTGATALYWLWFASVHWKGLLDPVFKRFMGLHLLSGRLQEEQKGK